MKYVDPGLGYDRKGYIPESVYWQSSIFLRSPDQYCGEDLVSGKVGKTEVRFSEIHSEYKTEHTNGKGHRRTEWHSRAQRYLDDLMLAVSIVEDLNLNTRIWTKQ